MEDAGAIIWLILVIIGVVISSFNKKNKAVQSTQNRQQQAAAAPQPAPGQAHAAPRPAAPAPVRTAQPTVASSLQVSQHNHEGMFQGSLNADDSGEGRDVHDHGFTHEVDMPSMHSAEALNASLAEGEEAPEEEYVGFRLPLTQQGLVQSLVMQEVLRRPCRRR